MKPDTRTAMRQLIQQVRAALPFDLPGVQVCSEDCRGCSQKLLSYLETELEDWERRLQQGERPDFGDLDRLAGTARKIHGVLQRNGPARPAAAAPGAESGAAIPGSEASNLRRVASFDAGA